MNSLPSASCLELSDGDQVIAFFYFTSEAGSKNGYLRSLLENNFIDQEFSSEPIAIRAKSTKSKENK